MKNLRSLILKPALIIACFVTFYTSAAEETLILEPISSSQLKIGVVDTKKCLENSKLGKQEQANFEKLKKQMESILQEKQKDLADIDNKLDDDDYMDSISEEAASELRRKRRQIKNDGMQLENQYMQTLQKANMQIIQKLTEEISSASKKVAYQSSYDAILTDEAFTFYNPKLDVSELIIQRMDELFEAEQKSASSKKGF